MVFRSIPRRDVKCLFWDTWQPQDGIRCWIFEHRKRITHGYVIVLSAPSFISTDCSPFSMLESIKNRTSNESWNNDTHIYCPTHGLNHVIGYLPLVFVSINTRMVVWWQLKYLQSRRERSYKWPGTWMICDQKDCSAPMGYISHN